MNKFDIINSLESYKLDRSEFIILSGAALVFYGLKKETNDIDLSVSKKTFKYLLNNFNCEYNSKYDVFCLDNTLEFSDNNYDVKYNILDGFKIQSLESIYDFKVKLNRDKDKEDIKKIKELIS